MWTAYLHDYSITVSKAKDKVFIVILIDFMLIVDFIVKLTYKALSSVALSVH